MASLASDVMLSHGAQPLRLQECCAHLGQPGAERRRRAGRILASARKARPLAAAESGRIRVAIMACAAPGVIVARVAAPLLLKQRHAKLV